MTAKKTDAEAGGEEPVSVKTADGEVIDTTATELAEAIPELVPAGEVEVYRKMDLEDERQIMEELQGRALDVMLYSFEVQGNRVTGFSWKGAREAVRTLNARGFTKIRMHPDIAPKIEQIEDEEGDAAIRVTVYAEDQITGGGNWGIAVAKHRQKLRNGNTKPDTFAVHKALSKAQRNAFEALVPLESVEYLKAQYLGQGRVKVIPGAEGLGEIEKPAPLDTPEAKALIEECREVWREIHALNPISMPPGAFNALITQNQHDLDRLADTKAHLDTFLAGERDLAGRLADLRRLVPSEVYDREVAKMAGQTQQRRLGRLAELVEQAERSAAS